MLNQRTMGFIQGQQGFATRFHPAAERGFGIIDFLPAQLLLLAIERQMIDKFADQDLGEQACTGPALFNRTRGKLSDCNAFTFRFGVF